MLQTVANGYLPNGWGGIGMVSSVWGNGVFSNWDTDAVACKHTNVF